MKVWSLDDIVNRRHVGGERYYDRDEVDTVLKRQASAAIAGMNAATAISSGQVQQAHRLRAESSPEALESERQANAILTDRIAELERELDTMNLAVGYFHEENDRFITRIAELECGIKGCVLPKHHGLLPETHPHRWCSTTWIDP